MRRFAITVLSVALIATATPALAGKLNLIHVSGQGAVGFTPDVAHFQLGVRKSGSSVPGAVADHNDTTNAVLQALRTAGIASEDLKTIGFTVRPRYSQGGTIVGYVASSNVQVRTTRIDEIGSLMSVGITAGATDVGGLTFGLVDRDQAVDDALANAVADAERKANALAQATGVQLGAPVSISVGSTPGLMNGGVNFSPESLSSVPIEIGSHQVRASVELVYDFN
jgi:uncharacterized protein YggE